MSGRLLLLILFSTLAPFAGGAEGTSLPDLGTVLSNVVQRSQQLSTKTNIWLHYNRTSIVHHLDSKEHLDKKVKRAFWVVMSGPRTQTVLLSVDDKAVEEDHEERNRVERRREFPVTAELIRKFEFTWQGKADVEGRSCFVLTFKPRPKLEDSGLVDKVVNHLAGTVWVDAEEYEIAKLDVKLQSPVGFFGGFVGSLSKLHLTALKRKVAPNFWSNSSVFIEMKGRKVLSGFHFRAWEQASDFVLLPDPQAVVQQ